MGFFEIDQSRLDSNMLSILGFPDTRYATCFKTWEREEGPMTLLLEVLVPTFPPPPLYTKNMLVARYKLRLCVLIVTRPKNLILSYSPILLPFICSLSRGYRLFYHM